MDNTGQLLILRKHVRRGESTKKHRRHYCEPSDIDQLKELTQSIANREGEDYLIVQVVYEASKPDKEMPA